MSLQENPHIIIEISKGHMQKKRGSSIMWNQYDSHPFKITMLSVFSFDKSAAPFLYPTSLNITKMSLVLEWFSAFISKTEDLHPPSSFWWANESISVLSTKLLIHFTNLQKILGNQSVSPHTLTNFAVLSKKNESSFVIPMDQVH